MFNICSLTIFSSLEYCGVLIKLFQPYVIKPDATQSLAAAMGMTWQELIAQAKIRLETLLRLYYLRHSFEWYDPMLTYWLIFLGRLALERLKRDVKREGSAKATLAFRSTLILCAQGLHSQGQNFHIAALLYRAFRDRMDPDDRDFLNTHISSRDGDEDLTTMDEYIRSQWPSPIVQMNEEPRQASFEILVKKTEQLSIQSAKEQDSGKSVAI